MSQFLGPVHYWQFTKTTYIGERLHMLHMVARKHFGELADRLYDEVIEKYGVPVGANRSLEELIGEDGIHAGLEGMLQRAEKAEALYIEKLCERGGEAADELVAHVWLQHGRSLGRAADRVPSGDAMAAARALYDHYADGMPCDEHDRILYETKQRYGWEATHICHRALWQAVGADEERMRNLYTIWFRAFVRGLDCDCRLLVDESTPTATYQIVADTK